MATATPIAGFAAGNQLTAPIIIIIKVARTGTFVIATSVFTTTLNIGAGQDSLRAGCRFSRRSPMVDLA